MAPPAVGPYPGMMLTTPGGKPAYKKTHMKSNRCWQLVILITELCINLTTFLGTLTPSLQPVLTRLHITLCVL